MSAAGPRPSRGFRALLVWAERRLRTPELTDDADDLFAAAARRGDLRAARRWYRRQALASVWRAIAPARPFRPARAIGGWFNGLSLDARLGVRMLARYPGLTLVGGLSVAFAVFIGAGLFEFINQTLPGRDLPLPDGHRVVGLRYWDRASHAVERARADDVRAWREALGTVEHVGGFRTVTKNLTSPDGVAPIDVALMSPSGFRVAAVPPLFGRVLSDADAEPGANPVVVLGHRVWRARFRSDPAVVGDTVSIGDVETTVVGVMPEGFGFPVSHTLWVPLRLTEVNAGDGSGSITVFGRLADGATLEAARAEAAALAARGVAPLPDRESVSVQVLPYRESLFNRPVTLLLRVMILQLNVFAGLFLMLVSANIALLMFARAATRERELLVRSALGADRRRIVTQFFVEALVLFAVATGIGLAAVGPGLAWLEREIIRMGGGTPPFWAHASVSPLTAAYAVVLALIAAVVSGVLPGLKATRQALTSRLNQASGGGGGLRFGGIWTVVVVTQVAATVVFTAGALLMARQAHRSGSVDARFPAAEYLTLQIETDAEPEAQARYLDRVRELTRRIASLPGVAGVTVADQLPLTAHPSRLIEIDGGNPSPDVGQAGHAVSVAAVDARFFEVFGAPVIAGRDFHGGDQHGAPTVIVDESFVQKILGRRNPIGRRLREVDSRRPGEPGPWLEIVGVVPVLDTNRSSSLDLDEPPRPVVYRPVGAGQAPSSLRMAIHAPRGLEPVASALPRTAAEVSSALRLHEVRPLDQVASDEVAFWRLWANLTQLASAVALLLSLAGIYAVMSFTVSRRTREIGVRVALGAPSLRVVVEIFRGPMAQVAAGVVVGCAVVAGLLWNATAGVTAIDGVRLVILGAAMTAVCGLACIGPTRRALRVAPTEALGAAE